MINGAISNVIKFEPAITGHKNSGTCFNVDSAVLIGYQSKNSRGMFRKTTFAERIDTGVYSSPVPPLSS